jgi:hypothetical protein
VWRAILEALAELSDLYPEWRLGQLVVAVADWAKGSTNRGTYDVEDADFLAAARAHLQKTVPA